MCAQLRQQIQTPTGRRTEQAKANLDPRVGPRVGPRVAPRVAPREPPREHPRGLISLFSALQGLPTKHPTKVSTEGPTSGRSGFTFCSLTTYTLPIYKSFLLVLSGFLGIHGDKARKKKKQSQQILSSLGRPHP